MSAITSIPVEASTLEFVPDSFKDLPDPPTFTLRYGTRRDRHAYLIELRRRGVVEYDVADYDRAFIEELRSGWAEDEPGSIEQTVEVMERYFTARDELKAANLEWAREVMPIIEANEAAKAESKDLAELPPAPTFDFDPGEAARVESLLAEIKRNSQRIRDMEADELKSRIAENMAALAMGLAATSLPVDLKRGRDGMLTEASIDALADALERCGAEHGVNGGGALFEIARAASQAFILTRSEEKNSPSPLPTTSGRSGSTKPDKTASTMAPSPSPSQEPDGESIPESSPITTPAAT